MRPLIRQIPLLLVVALLSPYALAADANETQSPVVKTEEQSVFKGVFYKVWNRLRAISPGASKPNSRRVAVTAGIRGSETTGSLMELYWKDDRTQDPGYLRELNQYAQAQQLAEQGDLSAAVKALSAFLDEHGDSDLRPNAQFALGLSYGGMGDKAASVATLQSFVKQHPDHPMVADAQQVIAELK